MNFALSAIIIILILTPGAIIIRAYYTSFAEKQASIHIPVTELLLRGISYSVVVHLVCLSILYCFGYIFDFKVLYNIISGNTIDFNNRSFTIEFLQFTSYYTIVNIISYFGSKVFKRISRFFNWDINYFSLRNVNYWFLIFSARYLESAGVQGEQKNTDLIYIDALTEANVLYSGFLIDFNYCPYKDLLENVVLYGCFKRNFHPSDSPKEQSNNLKSTTGNPSAVQGDIFVLPYSKILNINISFVAFEDKSLLQ